jgi:hypothetical protein
MVVVMEGAQTDVARPFLLQRHELAYHVNDVSGVEYALDCIIVYFWHDKIV